MESGLHFINEIVFHSKLDYPKETKIKILQFLLLANSYMTIIYQGYITALSFFDGIIKHTFPLLHIKSNFKVQLPNDILYPNGKVPIENAKLHDIKKPMPYIDEQYK